MRYFIILLLIPSLLKAQSKAYNKDSTVWVETNDPRIKLLYYRDRPDSVLLTGTTIPTNRYWYEPNKYDTIGGWHLVSDTARDHWNPAYTVWLYEVRKYQLFAWRGVNAETPVFVNPQHFKWLDSNKKTFYLKVWQ